MSCCPKSSSFYAGVLFLVERDTEKDGTCLLWRGESCTYITGWSTFQPWPVLTSSGKETERIRLRIYYSTRFWSEFGKLAKFKASKFLDRWMLMTALTQALFILLHWVHVKPVMGARLARRSYISTEVHVRWWWVSEGFAIMYLQRRFNAETTGRLYQDQMLGVWWHLGHIWL